MEKLSELQLDVTISTVFLTIEASNTAGVSSIIIEIDVQDLVGY